MGLKTARREPGGDLPGSPRLPGGRKRHLSHRNVSSLSSLSFPLPSSFVRPFSNFSYQSSVDGFVSLGYTASQAEGFMRLAIELAIRAREVYIKSKAFVASGRTVPVVGLSLGSYGAMLCGGEEYNGRSAPVDRPEL